MRAPATPFFRDVRMPADANDSHAHERFLLDTYAERRAVEKPTGGARAWMRGIRVRAFAAFQSSR